MTLKPSLIDRIESECWTATEDDTTLLFDTENFVGAIINECYVWAKENGGLSTPVDYDALMQHFGLDT